MLYDNDMTIHAYGFLSKIPWWSFTRKCPLIKCQLMYNFHGKKTWWKLNVMWQHDLDIFCTVFHTTKLIQYYKHDSTHSDLSEHQEVQFHTSPTSPPAPPPKNSWTAIICSDLCYIGHTVTIINQYDVEACYQEKGLLCYNEMSYMPC